MAVIRGKQLVRLQRGRRGAQYVHTLHLLGGNLLIREVPCHHACVFLFLQRCEHCQKLGATVGCCLTSCTSNYHFMCSRVKNCVFLEDKKVYCQKHRDLIKGEVRMFLSIPKKTQGVRIYFARWRSLSCLPEVPKFLNTGALSALCGIWRTTSLDCGVIFFFSRLLFHLYS